jgi:hypothetical protein
MKQRIVVSDGTFRVSPIGDKFEGQVSTLVDTHFNSKSVSNFSLAVDGILLLGQNEKPCTKVRRDSKANRERYFFASALDFPTT